MKAPVLAFALLMPGSAMAASAPLPPDKPAEVDRPAATQQVPQDALPPYQPEIERLAGLMGTLSFMRDLCGLGDGAEWRARMHALIESEGGTPVRRDRLAGAFNEGQSGYAATYRQCTPAAQVVIERSLDEAAHLTEELARRYGG